MPIPLLIGAAASIGGSLLASKSGKGESRRSRRQQAEFQKKMLELEQEKLQFSREQFALFEPVIKDFSNAFTETSLEDIRSGRILTPEARQRINEINRVSQRRQEQLGETLGGRGVDDPTTRAVLGQQIQNQADRASEQVRASSIQDEVNRRFQFAALGQGARQGVTNAFSSGSAAFGNLAASAGAEAQSLAAQRRESIGSIGESLGFLAGSTDFQNLFKGGSARSGIQADLGTSA